MADGVGVAFVRTAEPLRFFEKQLVGEQPLSYATAEELYGCSMELLGAKPWEFLDDENLTLIRDSGSGELCYCAVLGALGSVFALQVYVGEESYRFYRRMRAGKPIAPGDFYATLRGVTVEYVLAKDQTAPDRELLAAFGHPAKRGKRAPIFRAYRPGHHPWYVTEGEARLLAFCLRGTLWLCTVGIKSSDIDYWQHRDVFPLVIPRANDTARAHFEVELVKAPEPVKPRPQAIPIPSGEIDEILRRDFARHGSMEADHFFSVAEIGEKNERKSCLSAAIVCEGTSGFAFQPELGKPGEPAGELLVRAVLGAIQSAQFIPGEIRVRREELKFLLGRLAEGLGIAIRVKKSLSMLDPFKEQLLALMGDPGEISGG